MLHGFPMGRQPNQTEPVEDGELDRPEPKTADGNKRLADIHLSKGRVHQAITRYKKAARMDSDPSYRTDLGDAYAYAELPLKAVGQYRKAMKSNPNRPEPHFSLAEVYTRYGKWSAAIAEYSKAIELSPRHSFYRYKAACAYVQAGRVPEAIVQLEEAVSLRTNDGFYHFELACLYADERRVDEAIFEMEQATMLSPDDDYYSARLGILYARAGQLGRAAESYRESIRLNPRNPSYRCLLADVYRSLRFETWADAQYEEAGDMDPYDAEFVERARRFTLGGQW